MCGLCVGPCECGAEMERAKQHGLGALLSDAVQTSEDSNRATARHELTVGIWSDGTDTPPTAPYAEGDLDALLAAFHGEGT